MARTARMTAVCNALAIASHGCSDDAWSGTLNAFELVLDVGMSDRDSMTVEAIIHALNVEGGPLSTLPILCGDRVHFDLTGTDLTWSRKDGSNIRMKMLTHLLERAMQSMEFERHEMVPCPMKSSNRLRKALVDLNLEELMRDDVITKRVAQLEVAATSMPGQVPHRSRAQIKEVAIAAITGHMQSIEERLSPLEKLPARVEQLEEDTKAIKRRKLDKREFNNYKIQHEKELDNVKKQQAEGFVAIRRMFEDYKTSVGGMIGAAASSAPRSDSPATGDADTSMDTVPSRSLSPPSTNFNPYATGQYPELAMFKLNEKELSFCSNSTCDDVELLQDISRDPWFAIQSLFSDAAVAVTEDIDSNIMANSQHGNAASPIGSYSYTAIGFLDASLGLIFRVLKHLGINAATAGLATPDGTDATGPSQGLSRWNVRPYNEQLYQYIRHRLVSKANLSLISGLPTHDEHARHPTAGIANKLESVIACFAALNGMAGQYNDGGAHPHTRPDGAVYMRYTKLTPAELEVAKVHVKTLASQTAELEHARGTGGDVRPLVPPQGALARSRVGQGSGAGKKECQWQGCKAEMGARKMVCTYCGGVQEKGYNIRTHGKKVPAAQHVAAGM